MKRSVQKLILITLIFIMAVQFSTVNIIIAATTPTKVVFTDKNLETAVRNSIKKSTGTLYSTDVEKIVYLNAENKNISNLQGIQFLKNLKDLRLPKNKISDLKLLAGLSKLYLLVLNNNIISDVSPLKALINLEGLWLYSNKISDISSLSKLTKLKKIYLNDNNITNMRVLKNFVKLTDVQLWDMDKLYKIEAVQKRAEEIISLVVKPGMSQYEKELFLHDYVVAHTKYDYKNYKAKTTTDDEYTTYGILVTGTGVCAGYARTLKLLYNMVGMECYYVSGYGDGESHAWNIVKIDGVYYNVDSTWNDPTEEVDPNLLLHNYFNISDIQLAQDHTWDRTKYPKCTQSNTLFPSTIVSQYSHLYKMNEDGTQKNMIIGDIVADYFVSGDWIYYINATDNWNLYKVTTLGGNKAKVSDIPVRTLYVADNYVYYISYYDPTIYRISTDGSNKLTITSNFIITWSKIIGDWIYFKGFSWDIGAGIYKVKTDGTGLVRIGTDTPTGFNVTGTHVEYYYLNDDLLIYGDWIYYINASDGNKLYKMTTDGTDRTNITTEGIDEIRLLLNNIYIKTSTGKFYRLNANTNQMLLLN